MYRFLSSGLSQQSSTIDSIPVDHSRLILFLVKRKKTLRDYLGSITDDFLFAESTNSIPPNRTVNSDPLPPAYRQVSVSSPSTFSYQPNVRQTKIMFSILSSHFRILNSLILFQWIYSIPIIQVHFLLM